MNQTRWSPGCAKCVDITIGSRLLFTLICKILMKFPFTPVNTIDLFGSHEELYAVSKFIQRDCSSSFDARNVFHSIRADLNTKISRISPIASVIHYPYFETGMCKIQDPKKKTLTEKWSASVPMSAVQRRPSQINIKGRTYAQIAS